MEKILLGLLMLKRLTIYEMRVLIKQHFRAMCSDSLGSIQASIKKLLQNNMVTCREFVERGVNKKLYSISDSGRAALMDWLKTPMDMAKTKNMELGKLLFMGLVPKQERLSLIDEVLINLKEELAYLEKIEQLLQESQQNNSQYLMHIEQDAEYLQGLQRAAQNFDMELNVRGIEAFQKITLQLGIDTAKFQLDWFESLKNKIEQGVC